jgi:VWFA-related protein
MPAPKARSDTSGRIFIIFIDDLHLQPLDTPKVRNLLGQVRDTLIHENDLVGIVTTGYSSIAIDIGYDINHARLDEAIKKTMGGGMTPHDIVNMPETSQGPAGLRYNASVAFSTAYDILEKAAKITNRRKSFIYVSSGYDFNPFKDSRYQHEQDLYGIAPKDNGDGTQTQGQNGADVGNPFQNMGQQFAETDLVAEIAELVRVANRSNVTFYTIDPRGLTAGPDIGDNLTSEEWRTYVDTTVSSLKVLGDQTGGFCICQSNEFKKGLQRIDAETSDYYILGYNSNNPDPLKLVRRIEIRTTRAGVRVEGYRTQYTLPRPKRDKVGGTN